MRITGRRILLRATLAAGAAALLVGGVAVAARHATAKPTASPQTVSFTLNAPKSISQKTCSGTNGTYKLTKATYSGTSSGSTDSRFNGTVTMKLTTLVNTTTGSGSTLGTIKWANAQTHAKTATGSLWATDENAGPVSTTQPYTLQGFIAGNAPYVAAVKKHGKVVTPAVPHAGLYANFDATGSPQSG